MSKLNKTIIDLALAPAAIALALSISSCKKLIEIPSNPPNQIPTSAVFADSTDIMAAVSGVYASFKVAGGGVGLYSGLLTQNAGISSDELAYNLASDAVGLQFYNNGLLATNTTIESIWSSTYSLLYAVNSCLENIPGAQNASDALKNQVLGEMKVVRALHYFVMVNLYGGLPLVTTTDYHVNAVLPRASVDSVYSLIISDLNSARTLLTAAYPSSGKARINLYTADAILAKVYLYRKQWEQAADLATEVISSGKYTLVANPANVFYDGSTEAIWQLPANGTAYETAEGYNILPNPYLSTVPNYTLTTTLLNAFEAGDTRKTSWTSSKVVGAATYYYAYKYKNRSANVTPLEDYMMMRLGEVYLIRAEALANENKTDSAIADINMIRARAGLGASTATAQADVLAAVAKERQIELMFEQGNRWFDLKRTGTIDAVLSADKTSWVSTAALWPIPSQEILYNSSLTQNPGY